MFDGLKIETWVILMIIVIIANFVTVRSMRKKRSIEGDH